VRNRSNATVSIIMIGLQGLLRRRIGKETLAIISETYATIPIMPHSLLRRGINKKTLATISETPDIISIMH